jgi:hypothetical protein
MSRKSKEEVARQNKINNALAAEYKTASQSRRTKIMDEYYHGNEGFVKIWPKWDRCHWEDLTQIFATYWHAAFMRYTPYSEDSVFNFFMERLYKARASRDFRQFLHKQSKGTGTEFIFSNGDVKERSELFVHPQSDYDRAELRLKLSRSLDEHEKNILDSYFFGEKTLDQVFEESDYDLNKIGKRSNIPGKSARYDFNKKYEAMLDKMYLNTSKEELRQIIPTHEELHPLFYANNQERINRFNRIAYKKAKAAA